MIPVATVVFPTPEWVPPTTIRDPITGTPRPYRRAAPGDESTIRKERETLREISVV
jgi:hypothetical protein